MRKCKGCQENCWGKEWDEVERKWFCIENGEYLAGQKEFVDFT